MNGFWSWLGSTLTQALVIALGAFLVWGLASLWRRWVKPSAAVVLVRGDGRQWLARNASRVTLFDFWLEAVDAEGSPLEASGASGSHMQDLAPGMQIPIGRFDERTRVTMHWIAGNDRRHAVVEITDTQEIRAVTAKRPRRRLRWVS